MDHTTPPHWPTSLIDVDTKVRERLNWIRQDSNVATARVELLDIIEWVPEIAADSDMTEKEWLPIYTLSETLGRHLRAKDVDIADFEEDFSKLAQLLSEAHSKLNRGT